MHFPEERKNNCMVFLIYLMECFEESGISKDKIMRMVSRKRYREVL